MPQTTFSHGDLETLWRNAGGDPLQANTAAAIAQAESGGCLYAKAGPTDDRPAKICTYRQTNLENSYGLWQINRRAHPQYSAATPYTAAGNVRAAIAISDDGHSWTPWSTYLDGAYKQYLVGLPGVLPSGPPPAPGGAAGVAPGAHSGYADLRNSLARHLPYDLILSQQATRAALRTLAPHRKVGR